MFEFVRFTHRDGMTMTWEKGRQLASLQQGETSISYTYDADGMRMSKTVNGTKYTYQYLGGMLLQETRGNAIIDYSYDASGALYALRYKANSADAGTYYYYARNWRGDIVGLYDANGTLIATYDYNAWGKPQSVEDINGTAITDQTHIAHINPFRYRGYYYDTETGLYYVSSRYYDPEIGRWINADSVVSGTGKSVQGFNLYEYCNDNPVNKSDSTGAWPKWIKNVTSVAKKAVKKVVKVVTNAVNSVKSSFSLANHVEKTHVTTPTKMLDLGTFFGKVGFSSTVTKQNKEPGLVHSYSDVGNDTSKAAAGINIVGWLGADIGVSSEINAFVSAQVTPWVHSELSLGLDGIGAVVGLDVGDTSYDFEINVGWGLIALFVAPQVAVSSGQPSGAPAYQWR